MKNILFLSVLLVSCYAKIKAPDYDFMNKVKEQAGLDPLEKQFINSPSVATLHPEVELPYCFP